MPEADARDDRGLTTAIIGRLIYLDNIKHFASKASQFVQAGLQGEAIAEAMYKEQVKQRDNINSNFYQNKIEPAIKSVILAMWF